MVDQERERAPDYSFPVAQIYLPLAIYRMQERSSHLANPNYQMPDHLLAIDAFKDPKNDWKGFWKLAFKPEYSNRKKRFTILSPDGSDESEYTISVHDKTGKPRVYARVEEIPTKDPELLELGITKERRIIEQAWITYIPNGTEYGLPMKLSQCSLPDDSSLVDISFYYGDFSSFVDPDSQKTVLNIPEDRIISFTIKREKNVESVTISGILDERATFRDQLFLSDEYESREVQINYSEEPVDDELLYFVSFLRPGKFDNGYAIVKKCSDNKKLYIYGATTNTYFNDLEPKALIGHVQNLHSYKEPIPGHYEQIQIISQSDNNEILEVWYEVQGQFVQAKLSKENVTLESVVAPKSRKKILNAQASIWTVTINGIDREVAIVHEGNNFNPFPLNTRLDYSE